MFTDAQKKQNKFCFPCKSGARCFHCWDNQILALTIKRGESITEVHFIALFNSLPHCFTRLVQGKLEDDDFEDDVDNDINNRRMLSRFGVWLLVGVCNEPSRCESAERLGRLVSMTLSWIETVSTLRRDYVGELLKRLTSQYVCRWLIQVRDSKLDVLCACLSPDPPGYVKVGGCWDSMSSKVRQHMEGLHRLCCLVPHNLITPEVSTK